MAIAEIKYSRWNIIPHVPNKAEFDVREWDERTHVINTPWFFHYKGDIGEFKLRLLTGFQTDGGSVPKAFWNIIPHWGRNTPAFLAHDGIYAGELLSREQGDWILLEIMQACGESWFNRNAAWRCVSNFGGSVWDTHTKESIQQARDLMRFDIISLNKFITPNEIGEY